MGYQLLECPTLHQFWDFNQVKAKNRGKFVLKKVAKIQFLRGQME